jgi:hypothetical protein
MSKKTKVFDNSENHLVVFQEKAIRRTWHNEEWWFCIVDVVAVLTDSAQPEGYVKDLRRRDKELAKGWGQIATPFASRQRAVSKGLIAPTPRASLMKKSNVQNLHIANSARMLWDFRPLPLEQQSLPYWQQLRDE